MYNPNEIAEYFLSKYGQDGNITPMKLIKLVYIAHGWYLGITGNPLINEKPQAWKYGPVIESLYHSYKTFGNTPIKSKFSGGDVLNNEQDEKFLDKIWEVYGEFNGVELSVKTHQSNTPWSKVWGEIENSNSYSVEIPEKYIKEYYRNLVSKNQSKKD